MAPKRLLWQLYPSYLLITLIAMVAVTWYASQSYRNFYLDEIAGDLEARAHLAGCRIESQNGDPASADWASDPESVQMTCRELGEKSATRITVVALDGTVIGDSEENPKRMDNHAGRPEISDACDGRTGASTRYSYTLKQNMMYVAVPLRTNGEIAGVVRASIPVSSVDVALNSMNVKIAIGGLLIAALAAIVCLFVSRRISRPLEEMRLGAERFASGDLDHRMSVPGSLEIGSLAEAMNQMAQNLDERMRTVITQRNEQEAVLASMVEGVLAVDNDECVINMNGAAGKMLGVDPAAALGKTIHEVVRNTELHRFVSKAFSGKEPIESEIFLGDAERRLIQAHGTALRADAVDTERRGDALAAGSGQRPVDRFGALVVLNDITRLHQLENVRREFVANVSHELKTPITSIKGSVETLLDGGGDDPLDTRRFLEIIQSHADRLNAIIDDLLSLSRIEQEKKVGMLTLESSDVRGVLDSAARLCEARASDKKVLLTVDCDEDLLAMMDRRLLEQAVVNLVDNAIKYSAEGATVSVDGAADGDGVAINVRDSGCGIAHEHLPRLFERFYRVDKARSRKLGGTGLGLSITKHIVSVHGGSVSVKSEVGRGSVFTIHLKSA